MKKMKRGALIKNQIVKNVLSAIVVAVVGFILLNLAFIFDALYQGLVRGFVGLFISKSPINGNYFWFPPLMHASFVVIIGIISWFIFRSRMRALYKATYMAVPLAVFFATIGMFFYQWQVLVYSLGILFGVSVLYYLYRTKQPWIYYYTLVLISFVMLLVVLLGIEI